MRIAKLVDAKKAERKIPFGHAYISKNRAVGIRSQVCAAEIIFRPVADVCVPTPEHRLLLLNHIFRRFVLTGHGDAVIGAGGGILRSWDFDERGAVGSRGNFDDSVD